MFKIFEKKTNRDKLDTLQGFTALTFLKTTELFIISLFFSFLTMILCPMMSQSMRLFVFLGSIMASLVCTFLLQNAFYRANKKKTSLFCYVISGVTGIMLGFLFSSLSLSKIGSILLTSCVIFIMCSLYGYYTNKDLSQIGVVVRCLLVVSMCLSFFAMSMGLMGLFLKSYALMNLGKSVFRIETFVSFFLNILFISYLSHENKKIFSIYKGNKKMLELYTIFNGYILWTRLIDLIILLLRMNRKDD